MKVFLILFLLLFANISISQTQNFWTKKADFSGLKRERAVAFSINGKGYVATGVDTADVVKNDLWEYDPVLNTWTQKANIIGVARRNAIGFALNDKGYVGTGMDNAEASLGNTLSDFMEYDPAANTWVYKTSFPGSNGGGIYFATGFSADSKGYICGGKRGPNNYTDEFWEYKQLTDSWIQRQSFPGGVRYQLCSFVINNLAYIGLGIDQDVYRKDLWEYNPSTNSWVSKNDFLGGERGATSTFSLGERGFVCTGSDGGFKNDLWEYNPFSDSWSVRANFGGSERKNAISFSINGKAYVGTGKGFSGKKMSFYEYTPYAVLSVGAIKSNNFIKIFPNPVTDFFVINSNVTTSNTMLLYNIKGDVVLKNKITNNELKVNRGNLISGVYFIVITNQDETIHTQKIIFE